MTTEQSMAVLDWMGALSDPTRIRLLRACEARELSVAELCAVLQLPQSTASRHIKALVEQGWLDARREGTSRFYRGDRAAMVPAARRLWRLVKEQCDADPELRDDDARLERVLLERQSRSEEFFATGAASWDKLRTELYGDRFEAAVTPALLPPNTVMADLGCGTGRTTELFAPFVACVHGVDSSASMLKKARQRLRGHASVTLHKASLDAVPLDDGALDLALMVLVLHHVSEPLAVLTEVARTLKPGGRIVLVDMLPHDRHEYRGQMGHVWLGFDEPELADWFTVAGLQRPRYTRLPADPSARGPGLFVATASRAATSN